MNDIEKQILDLIKSSSGKSADIITKALKTIGNGKMGDGLNKIAEYLMKSTSNLKKGRMQGALVVGSITIPLLIIVGIKLLKDKIKTEKNHKEEGEAILKELKGELSSISNNLKIQGENIMNKCECGSELYATDSAEHLYCEDCGKTFWLEDDGSLTEDEDFDSKSFADNAIGDEHWDSDN